jgi:hypothetical protein
MTKKTKKAISTIKATLGIKKFTMNTFDKISDISWATFIKYVSVEQIAIKRKTLIPLVEFVNFVNELAGEDLYDTHWEFVTQNDKVYKVTTTYSYRIIE